MRCSFYSFSHNRNQNVNIRRMTSITIRTIVKKNGAFHKFLALNFHQNETFFSDVPLFF